MSNMYITEPNTEGKVLLRTSFGDLDVELWPQQAPKACRNFVQLSLEGYYDNTIFHRVIEDFMIQGGDPTGTGSGGESVDGAPFIDEFHSRLKFNHRGIVAMANENKPNSNHSQFFFTLDACEFLNRKHTIFGKITGNTIFNLLTVNGIETDGNDRPLNPPKLLSVEVLWNPFDDVVPRAIAPRRQEEDAAARKKRERKATKDRKLLSFADDEDAFVDDEEEAASKKKKKKMKTMMSSHDLLTDKKLKAEVDATLITKIAQAAGTKEEEKSKMHNAEAKKKDARTSLKAAVAAAAAGKATKIEPIDGERDSPSTGEEEKPKKPVKKDASDPRDEYTRLRAELKREKKAAPVLLGDKARELEKAKAAHDMLTPLQQQRLKYLERKKAMSRSGRQQETLKKLAQFQATLQVVNQEIDGTGKDPSAETEAYHGQVLEADEVEDGDVTKDKSWMAAKLKFKKHIDDQFRNSSGQTVDDYMTIDTRDMKKIRDRDDATRRTHRRDRSADRGRDRSSSRGRDRR